MQTAVILFQILAPETAQLSESLADDPQIRESLIQSGGSQRLFSGLSQCGQYQDLLAFVLQVLLQLCRQLRRRNRLLISDGALVAREAAPQGCPDVNGKQDENGAGKQVKAAAKAEPRAQLRHGVSGEHRVAPRFLSADRENRPAWSRSRCIPLQAHDACHPPWHARSTQ